MKLDLTPILKNPGAALDFSFDEPLDMLEGGIGTVTFTGPVHLEGSIRNFNGMLELDALAGVSYQTQCDRCCEPISDKLSVAIHEDVTEESGKRRNRRKNRKRNGTPSPGMRSSWMSSRPNPCCCRHPRTTCASRIARDSVPCAVPT
jgi:hypothetical protein